MKTKGVFLVPTFMALDWVATNADGYPPNIAEKARVAAASHGDMFRAALRIGVPVALGTDAPVRPAGHYRNAMGFALMVDAVRRPGEDLPAGTRNSARRPGPDHQVGSLKTGKGADR